jgi:hypothetical protein
VRAPLDAFAISGASRLRLGKPPSNRRCNLKQRAVALIADYVRRRGIGRVVGLKPMASDDYVLAIEDVRDKRVHVGRTPRDWLRAVKEGRHVIPAFGLCGRCGEVHSDRDWDLEIFRTCIPCQADLVDLALELDLGTEVE